MPLGKLKGEGLAFVQNTYLCPTYLRVAIFFVARDNAPIGCW